MQRQQAALERSRQNEGQATAVDQQALNEQRMRQKQALAQLTAPQLVQTGSSGTGATSALSNQATNASGTMTASGSSVTKENNPFLSNFFGTLGNLLGGGFLGARSS